MAPTDWMRPSDAAADSNAAGRPGGEPATFEKPRDAVALRCRNLVKRYEKVVAVDGLDLTVYAGECFGLLGPNGAGKTTTVEILEGLLPADSGEVEVLGCRWGADDRALRERLGIQLQETHLNDKLSVEEIIRLFRSFYRRGRTVESVLRLVGLEPKRSSWVGKLSGGQRQRLAVACALVNEPEILFLDEPTTGLDPQSRRQLWGLLERFRADGGTIVLTTHYMEEAETLCDRVAIVDHGRVIASGTPAELVATLGADHVVEVTMEADVPPAIVSVMSSLPGVRDVRAANGSVSMVASDVQQAVPALLVEIERRNLRLSLLATRHATLEDVFVQLTGRHLRDD
jgi:ABC-2 type transport system ATP-binding protein